MKVTLDRNCIIHLANQTAIEKQVEAIVLDVQNQCFVVNIGASEMWEEECVLIGAAWCEAGNRPDGRAGQGAGAGAAYGPALLAGPGLTGSGNNWTLLIESFYRDTLEMLQKIARSSAQMGAAESRFQQGSGTSQLSSSSTGYYGVPELLTGVAV